jgi:hypothetical protein
MGASQLRPGLAPGLFFADRGLELVLKALSDRSFEWPPGQFSGAHFLRFRDGKIVEYRAIVDFWTSSSKCWHVEIGAGSTNLGLELRSCGALLGGFVTVVCSHPFSNDLVGFRLGD